MQGGAQLSELYATVLLQAAQLSAIGRSETIVPFLQTGARTGLLLRVLCVLYTYYIQPIPASSNDNIPLICELLRQAEKAPRNVFKLVQVCPKW
jgi:hypothetical protein